MGENITNNPIEKVWTKEEAIQELEQLSFLALGLGADSGEASQIRYRMFEIKNMKEGEYTPEMGRKAIEEAHKKIDSKMPTGNN